MAAKKKPAKKRGKASAKAAPKKKGPPPGAVVVMETPKHGVGKLKRGGNWGNKGGRNGGTPPSKLRSQLRADFQERRQQLLDVVDGVTRFRMVAVCEACGHEGPGELSMEEIKSALPGIADRLRAFDIMLKYGLGKAQGLDDQEFEQIVLGLGEAMQQRIRVALAPELAQKLLEQILDDWKRILVARRAVQQD